MSLIQFNSEEQLRQVFAKLLMRMPEILDVRITHGNQEYGKDLIFWTIGPFGEALPCACVIKNGKIGGSADRPTDARTVCIQAQQALDTPFTDSNGSQQLIHRVYIVSPEPISQSAMNSIRGWLQLRAGAIVFVPGEKLFELIRKYWSDFLVEEFAALDHHLQQLAEKSLSDDLKEISSIYGLPSPEHVEEGIYVPRTFLKRLNIYGSYDLVMEPVPSFSVLQRPWTDRSFVRMADFLEALGHNLEHMRAWSLIDIPESPREATLPLSELRGRLVELGKAFKSALILEQARVSIGDQKSRKKEAQKEAEYTIPLAGFTMASADEIRRQVFVSLTPLRNAVRSSRQLKRANQDGLGALQSPDAKATSMLTDCLAVAPVGLLEVEEAIELTASEEDLHSSTSSWWIVGPAGYGKTSFCRWHALVDAQHYRSGEANLFPVYVPLNILARRELKYYGDAFLRTAGRSALFPEDIRKAYPAREVKLRLYLDGLDEVPDSSKQRQIAVLAREANADGIQIFLTSRDYVYMPELEWLTRIEISELDKVAQSDLVARILRSEATIQGFYEQLAVVGSLRELMGVPLLARLIVLVFRQTGELPESRPRLYSTFVDLLSGGWDLAKGLLRPSRFGRVSKRVSLCRLAGVIHEARRRFFAISDVDDAVRTSASALTNDEIGALRVELLRDGLLSRSARTFYFSHLSFQEFLCALYYHGSPDQRGIERALQSFLNGDDWWREVITFYIGLSENPAELSRWLAVKLATLESSRGSEVWQIVRKAFPHLRAVPGR